MSAREGGAALLCACVALLLCAAADALDAHDEHDAHDKRAESEFMSPMPFVLGSRYGRSQPRMIAPRNDRFFMGSRYGKRSEPPAPPLAQPPRALVCEYAGVYQLYRCSATHSLLENRRAGDDKELGED